MDDYPPISSSLTFKGESYPYSVFFGEQTPSETRADIGDLFFVSPHPNEARARIRNKEGRPRAETEGIFMKTDDGWTEMPYGREGMNHTPLAKHPTFGASYRLDEAFCAWKSKTWYTTDRGKKVIGNIISQEPVVNTKRSMQTPWISKNEYEPVVNTKRSMQNPWIFNEYVRWTSPPLSFVSPTQDVGKQIFTTLANLPRILFSRPRTESTIQFGMSYEASVRPSLSLCIQDLMDGSSQGLATPINSIFGIQAPHVQARDVLASIMTATDRADWGDGRTLLSALDIRFSTNGLGKCQLDANPYDSDNRYICDRNTKGQINWGGVLTPAGAITHPHIDYHGAAQLMYHIHGRKLWLFWPATTRNIRILLERELREGNPIELPEAIHVLEELDVLLLEDTQEAFYLPAGMIHAAISFTTCSHAGVYVWAIDEYLIAQDLVNYHLSFATESIATHIPSTVDCLDVFCRDIDSLELQKWEALAFANQGHIHSTAILEWVKCTRAQLHSLIKDRIGADQVLPDETVGQSKDGKKRKKSQLDPSRQSTKRKQT